MYYNIYVCYKIMELYLIFNFYIFQLFVVQHCEVTMVNAQFSRHVASLETREGCPITPGASFTKQFYLVPLASSNKDRYGIALDGHLKV